MSTTKYYSEFSGPEIDYRLKKVATLEQQIETLNNGGLILKDDVISENVQDWLDDHPEATTTVQDGSLTEPKFSETLKILTVKDYVTPEMFGATGDGVTDDTAAFVEACESGKPVYVSNSLIKNCVISNCKVQCKRLVVTGVVTCKSLDLSGNVIVDGGSFVVSRTSPDDATRDDSVFHDLFFDVIDCETLLTLAGTLYNFRFLSNTVRGKCSRNVISFQPASDGWITYTVIRDSHLGTCDTPIYIEGYTDNIQILNTFAQRYEPDGVCRFITTGARGRTLCLYSSFMYDLADAEGDTNLYLVRGSSGDIKYGSKFMVSVMGNGYPYNAAAAVFAQDSNGAVGWQLAQEISMFCNDDNGYTIPPRPLKNGHSGFGYKPNITDFAGYGYAVDGVFGAADIPGSQPVAGTMYRFGNAQDANSTDIVIGADKTGVLSLLMRNSSDNNWSQKSYIDRSMFDVHPSEATQLTNLDNIPLYCIGTYRLSDSLSPTGSAFYASLIRFGDAILALRSSTGTLYFASKYNNAWSSWKIVNLTT